MTQADTAVERLGAEYFSDPYSVHARLRARHPVAPVIMPGGMPAWLVTGYAQARAALTDPRLLKMPKGWRPGTGLPVRRARARTCSTATRRITHRLRKLVNKAFTARRVEQLRPRITAITAGLLDDMSAQREVDLLAAFAFPLPVTVICELLGVPVGRPGPVPGLVGDASSRSTVSPEVFQADAHRDDRLLPGPAGRPAARTRR